MAKTLYYLYIAMRIGAGREVPRNPAKPLCHCVSDFSQGADFDVALGKEPFDIIDGSGLSIELVDHKGAPVTVGGAVLHGSQNCWVIVAHDWVQFEGNPPAQSCENNIPAFDLELNGLFANAVIEPPCRLAAHHYLLQLAFRRGFVGGLSASLCGFPCIAVCAIAPIMKQVVELIR
jgi:hypothetical protein